MFFDESLPSTSEFLAYYGSLTHTPSQAMMPFTLKELADQLAIPSCNNSVEHPASINKFTPGFSYVHNDFTDFSRHAFQPFYVSTVYPTTAESDIRPSRCDSTTEDLGNYFDFTGLDIFDENVKPTALPDPVKVDPTTISPPTVVPSNITFFPDPIIDNHSFGLTKYASHVVPKQSPIHIKKKRAPPLRRRKQSPAWSISSGDTEDDQEAGFSSDRPHFCGLDGCTQSCKTKGDLVRHQMARKHKEPGFVCEIGVCQKAFTRKDALRRHVKVIHKRRC